MKKKIVIAITSLILLCAGGFCIYSYLEYNKAKNDPSGSEAIAKKEKEIEDLEEEIKDNNAELSDVKTKKDTTVKEYETWEKLKKELTEE